MSNLDLVNGLLADAVENNNWLSVDAYNKFKKLHNLTDDDMYDYMFDSDYQCTRGMNGWYVVKN